jgi:uncharacterized protein Smg (DUF494 family)
MFQLNVYLDSLFKPMLILLKLVKLVHLEHLIVKIHIKLPHVELDSSKQEMNVFHAEELEQLAVDHHYFQLKLHQDSILMMLDHQLLAQLMQIPVLKTEFHNV